MKLYLVHCGYYDLEISGGTYEFHTNYFVVAADPQAARLKAKSLEEVKSKKMHIDGLVEVSTVDGFRINLVEDSTLNSKSELKVITHRELSTKTTPLSV